MSVALALSAIALSNQAVGSSLGLVAEQASTLVRAQVSLINAIADNSQGPTIFPIAFAALVSRSLRNIGRFKVEDGVKIQVSGTLYIVKYLKSRFFLSSGNLQSDGRLP